MRQYHNIYRYAIALYLLITVCCTSAQQPSPQKPSGGKILRFRSFSYVDQKGTGIEAYSFLMPSGWSFEGGITWILDNPTMPAVNAFRVYNPNGKEEFEGFPNQSFFWTTNPQTLGLFPPGSKYFGNTVKQPVNAQVALRNIILPGFRKQYPDLKILKDENLPELPQAVGAGQLKEGPVTSSATGAKLRVSYNSGGVPMEEEFYSVMEIITIPLQSMYGTSYNYLWFIEYTFSFKAMAGKLEENTKLFQTITSSFKINPKWFAKYSNVVEYLAQKQIKRINSIGEFSRMLSQMSDEIREDKMQQYKANSDAYDMVSQKFSDNTLGIDRYYDPNEGREVELPSGYNHAWSNNNGEYIVTDNPNFNPNEGSNLHWLPLEKK